MTSDPAKGEEMPVPEHGITPRLIRLRGLAVGLPCAGLLAIAASLTPSSLGYGTHTELHLPACGFMLRTGYPCPSCGMTTAFAAMMHGQFLTALRAQPFGAVLAVVVACLAILGLAEAVSGKSVIHRLRPGYWWIWIGLAGLIVGWGLKILIVLTCGNQ